MHHPAKRSLAMCEHTGGVSRDFIVITYRDICSDHSIIERRNCLMTEAANSRSAAVGPELPRSRRNAIANIASDSAAPGLAWVRVCVLWRPRCINSENAGKTMTVLHHALFGDDSTKLGFNDICLLYTSPSPRDKRQSRMPSSA